MKDKILISCVQTRPLFGDPEANLSSLFKFCSEEDADLIIFPELCTSGYEIRDRDEGLELAFAKDDPKLDSLHNLVVSANSNIVFGFPEKSKSNLFNSSMLMKSDGSRHVYRKVQLFDREKLIFDPGDEEPFVVETEAGKLGMMICFDWLFPEIARTLALKGAQILVHPSNLVLSFCQRAMFARSVENGVYSVTCNRIGSESQTDRTLTFTGASQILSNKGETLAQAGIAEEEVIRAEINPALADEKMITDHNHRLNDRRVEMYSRLT